MTSFVINPYAYADGGGAPFSPADVTSIGLWLPNDGYVAGTWTDESGNGRDFTQGTVGQQPAATTVSGVDVVEFVPTDHLTNGSVTSWGDNITILAVAKRNSDGTQGTIFDASTSNNFGASTGARLDQRNDARFGVSTGTGSFVTSGLGAVWVIQAGRYDGTTMELWLDGGTAATSTAETGVIDYTGVTTSRVGQMTGGGTGEAFSGYIAEVIVIEDAVSNSDLNLLGNYLADKLSALGVSWTDVT